MNVDTCQNSVQTKSSGMEARILPVESQTRQGGNKGFKELFSLTISQVISSGANSSAKTDRTGGTETGVLKNPLLQLLKSAEGEGNETVASEDEDGDAETDELGISLLTALQGGLANVFANGHNSGNHGSGNEENQTKVDENPGKLHLVEKLQDSSQRGIYDGKAWHEKPVRNIMSEETNPEETRQAKTMIAKNFAEADNTINQNSLPAGTGAAEKISAIGNQNDENAVSLDGFEAVNALEAVEFSEVFKEKLLKNSAALPGTETGPLPQNVQSTNTVEPANGIGSAQVEPGKLEAYSQIGLEIVSKLEQKGPMEFKMQLQPENLGNIDIQLKVSEGKLIIDITAASSKTQSLLVSQVDRLIANLGLQNVQVETVQVGQASQINQANQANSVTQTVQGIPEQLFAMSNGMNFSQRGNQNQMTGQDKNVGKDKRRDDQIQSIQVVENSGNRRNLTRKMDYAI